ncbi:hypothetical protein PTSG_10964 [Salpingoeca rosetta]|uniref:Uncharacterized protein n=1 Tax=Salpingoeca rosetta (strain ATCC 50818 / BSB-021) TaxID=946362 RepID=F2USB2_SALR5|nr:uncharacterized protein PTSG_10964 [Salpingoeca rosetta]EGD81021.1 hypothetical protein PTSG_10964 [Salpingoeca rosetta]|eukprot:XP_004987891.1 hypothetical protein PTSG_10964 [Salpingoeca rosetta]
MGSPATSPVRPTQAPLSSGTPGVSMPSPRKVQALALQLQRSQTHLDDWAHVLSRVDVSTCERLCRRVFAHAMQQVQSEEQQQKRASTTTPGETTGAHAAPKPTTTAIPAASATVNAKGTSEDNQQLSLRMQTLAVAVTRDIPHMTTNGLPHDHAVAILHTLVLPACLALASAPSRALQQALLDSAAARPQAVVDGVIAPLMTSPGGLGVPQRVLALQVARALSAAPVAQAALSRVAAAIVASSTPLTDNMCEVLAAMAGLCDAPTQTQLASIVSLLSYAAVPQAESLRFAKLVLAVLQLQGVVQYHGAAMKTVVDANKTFLRRKLAACLA